MKKHLRLIFLFLVFAEFGHAQQVQPIAQLKTFNQTLAAANLQFLPPKDFKEIKALHTAHVDVDYAMELPNDNFQVWYLVKNLQQEWPKFKASEDNIKRVTRNPDSLYNSSSLIQATLLAGKDNFTSKNLPPSVLTIFNANEGKSYQLNLYDRPETNHFQYGLLICLQKNGVGYISMLFMSNDNGPDFYKKVNKAYYSVKFN